MSNIKSYREALAIATALNGKTSKAAVLLAQKAEQIGRPPTFVIMRYGDPTKWTKLPGSAVRGRPAGGKNLKGPFTLEHIDTAVRIEGDTVSDFCQKAFGEVPNSAQSNLSLVRRGLTAQYQGWYRPDMLARVVNTQDIYGNEKTVSLRDWVKVYGKPPASFFRLLDGRKTFIGGLALSSTKIKSVLTPKTWRIAGLTLKNGDKTIKANSVKTLAIRLGVSTDTVYPLVYGFRTDIKGYTIDNVAIERKAVLQPVDA